MQVKKFSLPCSPESFTHTEKKVVIVSVIGKSQYRAKGSKTEMVGPHLLVDLINHPSVDPDSISEIEGYYSHQEKTIYLHLRGLFDTDTLVNEYDNFMKKFKCNDFLSAWAHMRERYARALLVLFHISHIIILSHPTHTFDYSYVHLFRALDVIRQKTLGQISTLLTSITGLPKSWYTNSRPCSPRILFYFETCPGTIKNIKKLEHSLEDQIYHLLRKHRIVTNVSANSLFAIPANQEFVYVNTGSTESSDMLGYMFEKLMNSCKVNPVNTKNLTDNVYSKSERSFTAFLQQHIKLAFAKGFDDNVGRHSTPAHFEIPTVAAFSQTVNAIYDFFINSRDKELTNLHGLLDIDVKFSKIICNKALPRALQTYQDNLPQHYERNYHENKLHHAMSVFKAHARGPLFDEFAEKLQSECDNHWKTGRQMCEVLSLTGNPCTNPLHSGGSEGAGGGEHTDERKEDNDLPPMEHCSGVRYNCSCNCGRWQGPRDDPFNVKNANYDWFQVMAKQCGCSQLESVQFPVFQPSTHNYRAAQLFPGTKRKDSFGRVDLSTPQGQTQACSLADGTLHGYGSGGQSQSANEPSGDDHQKVVIQVSDDNSDNLKEKSLVRQPSTTEYLPGMLHTGSPPGLLPQFSSWSLVCLGPSSLYSHNLGLQHQTGILPNSAFLLPWDVTVRLEQQKDRGTFWPIVGDQSTHGLGSRGKSFQNSNALKCRKFKGGKEFVVKIFVGVEYECPRGHRFMAAAPDKILKATGSGIVKDSGNKVTSSTADMPLYFPCSCRAISPLIAQLMRIHVVTPKAPVHVTLNPRVQPGPPPTPIFIPGCEGEPIRLSQSAYWVLRLPYVYVDEKGPYLAPKRPMPISHGRLLAGMYGISAVVPEKK